MKKNILGLDLGTNSIGWALVDNEAKKILGMGSRIIPMDAAIMGDFEKGNSVSQTTDRTKYRGTRRLRERHLLRRERLHRVLNVLGFLPEHYAKEIDFEKRFGKFLEETEPKIAWRKNGKKENGKDKFEFLFQDLFKEMIEEFKKSQPQLFYTKANGEETKIPYDWTIYYLRKKALEKAISKEHLAWLILNFNQKRGYYQLRGEEEKSNNNVKEFVIALTIIKVEKGEVDKKNEKRTWYKMTLSNGWGYSATFTTEPKWENTEKEFLVIEEYDDNGNIKIVKEKKSDDNGKEKRKITPLPSFEEIDSMSNKDKDKIYGKIKARTELMINNSGTTVGTYIYDTLLQKPNQKIKGKLVRTIERKFYKNELRQILQKQIELQSELFTDELYNDCVRELYRSNEAHQLSLCKPDFVHLFLEDIIFYQRPLRSQKSSIGNCSLEYRVRKINKKDDKGNPIKNVFEKDENGKDIEVKEYLKAIPKSNPYYQEFRVWQWLYNLKIYRKEDDKEVTNDFLNNTEDYEKLFEFLMKKKEVNHKDILSYLINQKVKKRFPDAKPKALKDETAKEIAKHRWNYVYDAEKDKSKSYPMNETGNEIRRRLENVENLPSDFLTRETEQQLWHIIYSVNDKNEFQTALETFARKHSLYYVSKSKRDEKNPDKRCFVYNFKNLVWKEKSYGTFSEKAVKKLLTLMRLGKYWVFNEIDSNTKKRIQNLQNAEVDESIKNRVREQVHKEKLTKNEDYQRLPLWLAQYIVYDRHSEAEITGKWKSIANLEKYLEEFKQHSLRNPIVEQVITETLRVVKDIWQYYGKGAESFFDEIHIELGREMKNTSEDRAKITNQITENENTNLRIKRMLMEFSNDEYFKNTKDYEDENGEIPDFYKKGNNPVRPYSRRQQDKLKIYEEGIILSVSKEELDSETGLTETKDGKTKKITYKDISKKSQPSGKEVEKYKLWLEQKYRSPYTGEMIPLSKLFTPEYQTEHVIPKARYFDDSLSNKVICEAAVNVLKDKQLGFEFIKNHHGEKVQDRNKTVTIFSVEAYESFVKEHYAKNHSKRTKLLLKEIPDKMIERQLNDTRYISKFISSILSNIVREDINDVGVNSKNILPGNGKITSELRQDWGLNEVWNTLILPRFERMNTLTQTTHFTSTSKEGHTIPNIPLELSKGFQRKRIDHRHHALDALVIACATRDHVNLLNNQHAKSENIRYDLQNKLRNKEKWTTNDGKVRDRFTEFKKPWENFTVDAKDKLEKIVVSFKQNLRIINKVINHYEKIKNGKKVEVEQNGMNWAIRKSLHKETVSGKVELPRIKVPKGKILTATRKAIDTTFNLKTIEAITDTGIQKILTNYLAFKDNNPELAFTPEGLEEMNKNITQFNGGKSHQPIYKVRIFELGSKFQLGQKGNKKAKYVEAAKGTNLFFIVYERKVSKTRMFDTVPLNEVIEHQKLQLATNVDKFKRTGVPIKNILEYKGKDVDVMYLFHLSPNDLVYVPTVEELENSSRIDFTNLKEEQIGRIYKFTDGSDGTANFIPVNISNVLFNMNKDKQQKAFGKGLFSIQNEIGVGSQGSKNENAITGEQIKSVCIKLKVDRLGNVSKA